MACGDSTFENLPVYRIEENTRDVKAILDDSIAVDKGLFYRQISSKGYSEIFGHSLWKLSEDTGIKNEYELGILSSKQNHHATGIICSIDKRYQSIIDVITYDKSRYRIISIEASKLSDQMVDMKLLDISELTRRPDTLLVQSDPAGNLESFPLCCDF